MITIIAAAATAATLVLFTAAPSADGQRLLSVTKVKVPTLQACETLRDSLRGGAGIEHAQCETREPRPAKPARPAKPTTTTTIAQGGWA